MSQNKKQQSRFSIGVGICLMAVIVTLGISSTAMGSQTFNVTMTVDNCYAIYTGDQLSASSLIGSAYNTTAGMIWVTESYSLTVPDLSYVYIAAWSDDAVLQGCLADFQNITLGEQVLSGDPRWEVTSTGIDLDNGSPNPTLGTMTAQILLANAGSTPSGGWVPNTPSPLDNASGGIHGGTIGGIDGTARWMWYDSGLDTSPPSLAAIPFDGFNHQEFLIFRMPVIPVDTVIPEPASFAPLMFAGLLWIRKRRK